MNYAPLIRKSRILLLALGLAALALSSSKANAFRCECAPLGGEYCGADGRTYDSPCVAACFHVKIVHAGPC